MSYFKGLIIFLFPLLCSGESVELLKNGSMEGGEGENPSGWKLKIGKYLDRDKEAVLCDSDMSKGYWSGGVAHTGKKALGISSGSRLFDVKWISENIPVSENELYKISFYAKAQDVDLNLDVAPFWNELMATVKFYDENGHKTGYMDLRNLCGTFDWTLFESHVIPPPGSRTATLSFTLYRCPGKVWIDDVSFELLKNAPRHEINGKNFIQLPVKQEKAAPEYLKDEAKSLVFYRRRGNETVLPQSAPQPGEAISQLAVNAVKGEYEPADFSVYALEDIKDIKVNVGKMSDGKGNEIPQDAFDVRVVKCWLQRLDESKGCRICILTPELLEEKDTVSIKAGESCQFWITSHIPETAEPGLYSGNVGIKSGDGKSFSLPLKIRVYPFALRAPPGMVWWMSIPAKDSETRLIQLRDLAAHGVNAVAYGAIPVFKKGENNSIYMPEKEKKEWVEMFYLARDAGLTGPPVLRLGEALDKSVAAAQGCKWEDVNKWKDIDWSPEFCDAYKQAFRILDKTMKEAGFDKWYFSGVDEPGVKPETQERALLQYRLAKEAGILTFATSDAVFTRDKFNPLLDARIYHVPYISMNEKQNVLRHKELGDSGDLFGCYSAGCYNVTEDSRQEGNVMPDRYFAGFLAWKSGVRGQYLWTYAWGSGDIWDDLDKERKDFCILYPSKDPHDKNPVPTLQWEGIREGIDDFKYAYTLEYYIGEARRSDNAECREAAVAAGKTLERIKSEIPWMEKHDVSGFRNETADELRNSIADQIILLKKYLKSAGSCKK